MTEPTPPKQRRTVDQFLRALPRRAWLDITVLTVLTVIAVLGFAPSFSDARYLVAGLGGLAVGTVAGLLAAILRLGILPTAGVAVLAYFLFGSPLAMPEQAILGVLPSLVSIVGLALGAVFGWADIVTLTTPVAAPDYIGVLPYVTAWTVGLTSATIAGRWYATRRRGAVSSALGLAAPIAVYVTSVLTGTDAPYLATVRGVAFAVIALVWMAWRVPASAASAATRTAMLRRRIVGVVAVAGVAILGGGLLGAAAAPRAEDRFVLREEIQPPFDPRTYPSPLSAFRHYTNDLTDDVLFTVEGLPAGVPLRLATMDAFTGKLWTVADAETARDGSGTFELVSGDALPTDGLGETDGTVRVRVVVEAYREVWMPAPVGEPSSVAFEAGVSSTALRYNPGTGVLVHTGSLGEGDIYTLDIGLSAEVASLEGAAVAQLDLPTPQNVPDVIASTAVAWTAGYDSPFEKLTAIAGQMSEIGYLSHGSKTGEASSAGHGADRMISLLSRTYMVGDAEQYASAMALMARSLGFPARVVMGFTPEVTGSTVEVTGDDVDAWVEVAFEDVGWVSFYPTPDDTEVPRDEAPKPQSEPQPQIRQPPRADADQDDLVSAVDIEDGEDDGEGFSIPGWVGVVAAAVLIPLAVYFIPVLILSFLKRHRRRRRRTHGEPDRRAAGAWDELVDTYSELGYKASRVSTRVQLALAFEQQFREELEARRRERDDAATRAVSRAARAEATAEAKRARATGETGSSQPALGSVLEVTVVRAREASTWRPGVADEDDPLPNLPGLREFAVSADRAVFSGRELDDAVVEQLWADAASATAAAHRSVSWFRRRLSRFRIRLPRDVVADLAGRATAAASATRFRGATR